MNVKYAGADLIERDAEVSDLGRDVADLLGQVARGLYHLDTTKVNWGNSRHITVEIETLCLSTFDFPRLTELVVLAHDRCIRCEISAVARGRLRLMFHRRQRTGGLSERHPTIEEHIRDIRERIGLGVVEGNQP